jgi:hypothetical protein
MSLVSLLVVYIATSEPLPSTKWWINSKLELTHSPYYELSSHTSSSAILSLQHSLDKEYVDSFLAPLLLCQFSRSLVCLKLFADFPLSCCGYLQCTCDADVACDAHVMLMLPNMHPWCWCCLRCTLDADMAYSATVMLMLPMWPVMLVTYNAPVMLMLPMHNCDADVAYDAPLMLM